MKEKLNVDSEKTLGDTNHSDVTSYKDKAKEVMLINRILHLRRMQDMVALGQGLSSAASTIEAWKSTDPKLTNLQTPFFKACSTFSEMLLQFHEILSEGDIDIIQQWLSNRKSLIVSDVVSFPRLLRKQNVAIALEVTNALDDMRIAQSLFDEVEEYLDVGMVAVLADAGGGKTHLAAELSSAQENRPAGILLHGRNFHRGQNKHD